jgi:hypothetical protein
VRYIHLSLSTPVERMIRSSEQWPGNFDITCLGGVAALNIQHLCTGHLISHGTPSLHIFSSFTVIPQRHRPSAYKRPALWTTSSQSSRMTIRRLQVIAKQLCIVMCWVLLAVLAQQDIQGGLTSSASIRWLAQALRHCTGFCKHQVIPYSFA